MSMKERMMDFFIVFEYFISVIIIGFLDERLYVGHAKRVPSILTDGVFLIAHAFEGNDGEVARIKINIPEEMSEGDYPILLQDVRNFKIYRY